MLSTNFVPGAPDWIDLGTPDVETAAAFYTGLFGWDFVSAGPEAGGYGLFMLEGRTVAAVGPLPEDGADSAWTLYFHTPDADLVAKTVEQAGGTVRVEPFDVFQLGRTGVFTDPSGARFAVWQPIGNPGLDAVTLPGTLTWTELHTDDVEAARSFYHTVFAWETAEDSPFPEGRPYVVVSTATGGPDAAVGGIMQLDEERRAAGAVPQWRPYFEVTDVDDVVDRARAEGGDVEIPVVELEDVGRMAALTDPFGAPFSVIRSMRAARTPASPEPATSEESDDAEAGEPAAAAEGTAGETGKKEVAAETGGTGGTGGTETGNGAGKGTRRTEGAREAA
ncbi:VOC family protein [Streptomyces meridianus]|uniref:VOC family protein n=1 Tax=Streptomyces meridianus TaxID=2938945 RepID=UPI0027E3818D|nr:VOC family protein [Streptomyces meridianus]